MILPSKRRIERWNVWDYPKGLNCMLYDYEKVAQEERRTRKCVIGWMIVRVRFLPLSFIWIFPKKIFIFHPFSISGKAFTFLGSYTSWLRETGVEVASNLMMYIFWEEDEMEVNRSISVSQKIQVDSQKKVGKKWRVKWTLFSFCCASIKKK